MSLVADIKASCHTYEKVMSHYEFVETSNIAATIDAHRPLSLLLSPSFTLSFQLPLLLSLLLSLPRVFPLPHRHTPLSRTRARSLSLSRALLSFSISFAGFLAYSCMLARTHARARELSLSLPFFLCLSASLLLVRTQTHSRVHALTLSFFRVYHIPVSHVCVTCVCHMCVSHVCVTHSINPAL